MAFDGNGVFNRVQNFVADAAANINILASRQDNEWANYKAGLEACMIADGQNAATGDLDLGGNRFTNAANGTDLTDLATVTQLQNNTASFVTTTGSADAYVATLVPAITALALGQSFTFKANFANTGTATIAINGLAATTIKTSDGLALIGGEIATDQIIELVFDGTDFILTSPTLLLMTSQILSIQVFM